MSVPTDHRRACYTAALGVDPRPRLSGSASGHPDWLVHDISPRARREMAPLYV